MAPLEVTFLVSQTNQDHFSKRAAVLLQAKTSQNVQAIGVHTLSAFPRIVKVIPISWQVLFERFNLLGLL